MKRLLIRALYLIGAILGGLFGIGAVADNDASICLQPRCGLLTDGAYPHIVIGTVTRVGDSNDMNGAFSWAKAHQYWKSLPADFLPYLQDVKLIQISLPSNGHSRSANLFMQIEEYSAAPFSVGDLVRYAPHDAAHDTPPSDPDRYALFHGLTGCIAILCWHGDKHCNADFHPGVYRVDTGEQLNDATGTVEPNGIRIDTVSDRPLSGSKH